MKEKRLLLVLFAMLVIIAMTSCGGSSGDKDSNDDSSKTGLKDGIETKISTKKNDYGVRCACANFKNNTGQDLYFLKPSFHFVDEDSMDSEQKKTYGSIKKELLSGMTKKEKKKINFNELEIQVESSEIESLIKNGDSSGNYCLVIGIRFITTSEDISNIIEPDTIELQYTDGKKLMKYDYDYVSKTETSEEVDGATVGEWPDSQELKDVPEPEGKQYIVVEENYSTKITIYDADFDSFKKYKSALKEIGVTGSFNGDFLSGKTKSGNSIMTQYDDKADTITVTVGKS